MIIDNKLPSHSGFICRKVTVYGEEFDFYYRDIIECIRILFGDPELNDALILLPERHFTDEGREMRIFHNMHTGRWWWGTQVCSLLRVHTV